MKNDFSESLIQIRIELFGYFDYLKLEHVEYFIVHFFPDGKYFRSG